MAYFNTTYFLVRCTPPLRPLENVPFPLPPARIWAFITISPTSARTNQVIQSYLICFSLLSLAHSKDLHGHKSHREKLLTFSLRFSCNHITFLALYYYIFLWNLHKCKHAIKVKLDQHHNREILQTGDKQCELCKFWNKKHKFQIIKLKVS